MKVPAFIFDPVEVVAPLLLGWRVRTHVAGETTELRITEVEAYHHDDPASHSFGGPRGRNVVMFEAPGRLYVYLAYGIHWCANVVCGPPGTGAAVLLRAGTPTVGLETMIRRRGRADHLADGPGKLTSALAIDMSHNGIGLFSTRSQVRLLPGPVPEDILVTTRIGINKATDVPWRFVAR